jgi:hypothetical protein
MCECQSFTWRPGSLFLPGRAKEARVLWAGKGQAGTWSSGHHRTLEQTQGSCDVGDRPSSGLHASGDSQGSWESSPTLLLPTLRESF